jgi:formate hydrogenlyase subunit 3/multisubunit Na+/H+ antiporter MnhD subunit
MSTQALTLLPVLIPLAAGILALAIPRAVKWVRESLALLAAAAAFAFSLWLFIAGGPDFMLPLISIGDFSLSLDLTLTPLGSFALLLSAAFGLLITLYSLPAMAGKARLREYYAFLLFAIGGSSGVLLADHLLAFLIFWEIVTASLYFLVATGTAEARAGATKSFVMLGATDGCLLLGIGLLWYAVRSFSMSAIHVPVQGWLLSIAFLLIGTAALTKAGSMPFHSWIPAASEGAPAAVMAFLPAALDKLLGIYLLVRICTGIFIPTAAIGTVLMTVGAVTIVAAVLMAMVQHDLMRLLSYHAISQVGYMVLGIGTLTPIGIAGGLFHMLNHTLYKSCLFLGGGSVEKKAGTTNLEDLGGLAAAMPVTFASFLVASLAISGIPPLNGFASKWMIYQGAIQAGGWASMLFLVAAMFGSALTLASFIKALYSVFLGQRSLRTREISGEVNWAMLAPPAVLALACVGIGIFYRFTLRALIFPALGFSAEAGGVWDSTLATALLLIGLAAGLLLYVLGRLRKKARIAEPFIGGESMSAERLRVSGVGFYETLRSLPLLGRMYRGQEKGAFDPYVQIGRAGAGITWALRKLHNGMLPWYLAWSIAGLLVLFAVIVFL